MKKPHTFCDVAGSANLSFGDKMAEVAFQRLAKIVGGNRSLACPHPPQRPRLCVKAIAMLVYTKDLGFVYYQSSGSDTDLRASGTLADDLSLAGGGNPGQIQ